MKEYLSQEELRFIKSELMGLTEELVFKKREDIQEVLELMLEYLQTPKTNDYKCKYGE